MRSVASAAERRSWLGAAIVIGICATILGMTALVGFVPAIRERLGWTESERSAYAPGDSIDVPPSLYVGRQTLLVFASGTCGACRRSASVFAALAADLRGSKTHFLLVTPNVRHVDQHALANAIGLQGDEISDLDLSTLRLKNVPTVVLVDGAGRVLYSREGLVDEEGSAAIRRAIDELRS